MIIVSTDGSCLRNPGGAVGWAWVNHEGPSKSGGESSGTNQTAELRAVLEALIAHPGAEPLLIESDSQYAIKCASEWLPSWKRKGWKTAAGGPVKNLDLVQSIDRMITGRSGPVRFRWVRGHVGNHFNEMADTLAGEAARGVVAGTVPSVPPTVSDRTVSDRTVSDRTVSDRTGPVRVPAADKPATPTTALPGERSAESEEAFTLF